LSFSNCCCCSSFSGASLHLSSSSSSSSSANHDLVPPPPPPDELLSASDNLGGPTSGLDLHQQHRSWAFWKGRLGSPYFSNQTQTRVLVTRGQTCYLHCLVGNLGDRQVRKGPSTRVILRTNRSTFLCTISRQRSLAIPFLIDFYTIVHGIVRRFVRRIMHV
jgi:hypothetical protein